MDNPHWQHWEKTKGQPRMDNPHWQHWEKTKGNQEWTIHTGNTGRKPKGNEEWTIHTGNTGYTRHRMMTKKTKIHNTETNEMSSTDPTCHVIHIVVGYHYAQ